MNDFDLLLNEKRKYGLKEEISYHEMNLLKSGMPIQKIMGFVEMANVLIDLSKNVLIPRYETEELIYYAIDIIKKNNYQTVLDLGCGSGFIGLGIKKYFHDNVKVYQSDINLEAIEQTKINQKKNNLETNLIHSDMFKNINQKFDIIVSNPPYLSIKEKINMTKSVLEFEPYSAFFARKNGLEFYEIIEKELANYLNKTGSVLLEINPINVNWFIKRNYLIIKDINNKERFAFKQINYSINE